MIELGSFHDPVALLDAFTTVDALVVYFTVCNFLHLCILLQKMFLVMSTEMHKGQFEQLDNIKC